MKALIVDDSDLIRRVLRTYLQNMEITCVEAVNGLDALSILGAHTFDLVLLDIDMPVMNGIELLKEIRREQRALPTKVLMVTASAPSNIQDALDHGANDFMMKPFDESILREKITTLGLAAGIIQRDAIQDPGEEFFDTRQVGAVVRGLLLSSILWGLIAITVYTVYNMIVTH
jgi:two-component system, chemotaxis family, chemotaxis protein CheY